MTWRLDAHLLANSVESPGSPSFASEKMELRHLEASKSLALAIDRLTTAVSEASSSRPKASTILEFKDRLVDCWTILCGSGGVYGHFTDAEAAQALKSIGKWHAHSFGICDGYLKEITLRSDRERASMYIDHVSTSGELAIGFPFRDDELTKKLNVVVQWLQTKFFDLAALDSLKDRILDERRAIDDEIGLAIQDSGIIEKILDAPQLSDDSTDAKDQPSDERAATPDAVKLLAESLKGQIKLEDGKIVFNGDGWRELYDFCQTQPGKASRKKAKSIEEMLGIPGGSVAAAGKRFRTEKQNKKRANRAGNP